MDNYIVVGDPELAPDVPPSEEINDMWKAMGYLGAKNLIPYPYYHSSGYISNGITFTINDDFSVTANGTATAQAEFVFIAFADNKYLPIGDYKLSGISGGSYGTYLLQANVRDSQSDFLYDGERTIEVTDDTFAIRLSFKVQSGYVADNLTVRPMLRLASDTDSTYQPYALTNKQLTDMLHPIGTIIESTTCDTMAKVVATYGGKTWIQHTGYVLRGATSGVTSGSASKTGGADSVNYTPAGSVSKPTFTGTQATLSHTGGAVTNTTLTSTAQIPAHTHGSETLTGTTYFRRYGSTAEGSDIMLTASGIISKTAEVWSGSHGHLNIGGVNVTNGYRDKMTITATHEHNSVGGTTAHGHGFTQPTAHTYTPAGSVSQPTLTGTAATINTLPNYKSVYIWERTA